MTEILEQAFDTLKAGNPEERAEAVTLLGEHAYAPAVPYLAQLVREADPGTRYLAAQALSKIGDEAESAVPDLLVALRFDDMFLRMAITAALINIGHPSVPGLVKALFDDNKAVRRASAKALGKIGSDRAIPPLEVACKDSDAAVRRFANEAIERIQTSVS
ncbi:HEAT repeat domain-containing protein [Phototrophicus methaneseepsis]|uniref:HEAT repeat domain-containing protein n=1 Tax=Phototrophicus methaneseepsis TaxID=2710758 RepID=A0A7S8ECM4_9CHLR|nr:HEAT repeat domain-containing protein [Phototrophicus methaneseepsis]QPC84394.1 HEAT repeat domain-containing protein [Phototrophicus methaneseepsis]